MSITCDVILRAGATPVQLNALGTALWSWCIRSAGNRGIYQFLDNQALTDLIAGKLPASNQAERRGFHCWVRDEVSRDRRVTVDSLRREIPTDGVEDIFVDGTSWRL